MGVCHLQHRIVTGLHAGGNSSPDCHSRYTQRIVAGISECLGVMLQHNIRSSLYSFIVMIYAFLLVSVISVASNLNFTGLSNDYSYVHPQFDTKSVLFINRYFVNTQTFAIILFATHLNPSLFKTALLNFGVLGSRYKKLGTSYKIRFFLSFWHTILNLLLIIITFPAIKNPGPPQEEFSCLYQNVRGFVPFSKLGEKIPCLDDNKILDFHTYIFEHKPSMIVLTETWLCKEHNNNEIFPSESYTCFRLDRSPKTHPPDPNDPKNSKKRWWSLNCH